MSGVDSEYFSELVHQIPKQVLEIDGYLTKAVNRRLQDLNPVELAVLRVAVYEFLHRPDVPYKVIINEALQITKTFGSTEGHKYVNGVLDTLAKELRSLEIKMQQSKQS
jgi:N utilization substance protein B